MAKATIYLSDELWILFRQLCLARRIPANKVVARLIGEQVAVWKQEKVVPFVKPS